MHNTQQRLRITKRDQEMLMFLSIEGGATAEVLHRRFFPSNKRDALKSTIRRLSDGKNSAPLVVSEPLDERRVYYRLTHEGARLIGAKASVVQALGPITRIRVYAESWYLYVQRPGRRTRLPLGDLREELHLVGQRLPKRSFYFDETRKEPRLGIILVDHKASVGHTITKTVDAVARILRRGIFAQFIRQERFVVTVLTATNGAKNAIDAALQPAIIDHLGGELLRLVAASPPRFPLRFDVSVVPGLLSLLTSMRTD
jgi:hypothetical protein